MMEVNEKEMIETTAREIDGTDEAGRLALEINTIKRQTMRTVLAASIEIGERLCRAKALVPHGEWEKWLCENVDYSQSTANNLMKIYREYGDNQLDIFSERPKAEIFGELTYSQAVALFALPAHERADFVEQHDMAALSTRELEAEIERLKAVAHGYADEAETLREQLGEARDGQIADAEERQKLDAEIGKLNRKLEAETKARNRLEEERRAEAEAAKRMEADAADLRRALEAANERAALAEQLTIGQEQIKPEPTQEELDAIRSEVKAELQEEYKKREAEAIEKYAAKAEAEREAAEAAAKEDNALLTAELQQQIDNLTADRDRLLEAEQKRSAGAAVQQFAALFEAFQEDFNRMLTKLSALEASDDVSGAKIRAALTKVIESMRGRL